MDKRIKNSVVSPTRFVVFSFLGVILTGTFFLCLPFATTDGYIPLIDAFFTATSATCVTGLIVYDTYTKFTLFGQIVILCMIQVGGLGLVTFTTFFGIAAGKKLGFKTLKVASSSSSVDNVGEIAVLFKTIFKVVLGCEFTGFLFLSFVMIPDFGFWDGLWISFFTSISAFCNAGFDLLGRIGPFVSLTTYADNILVNVTVMLLIVSGGLGFTVWHEFTNVREGKKVTFHSKIVLIMTAALILIGAVVFMVLEWNNPATMKDMPTWEKVLAGFFQSVTTRTAGFNTIDQNGLTGMSKIFSSFLMFVGAAPGGTGGGIKVTTFAVVWVTVFSVIRGRNEAIFLDHKIDKYTVYKSVSIIVIALMAVCVTSLTIYYTSDHHLVTGINSVFESFSAFATVGLSTGVTGVMSFAGKVCTILTMFIGRVGPVSLAISLSLKYNDYSHREIVPDGRLIVG
ncbi:MAG: potassium transporter TrkG [Oscillospiraceae bacterium]